MSTKNRGFASMDPQRVREIASMGGKAAHTAEHKGHEWTSEEAKEAGRKGGLTRQARFLAKKVEDERVRSPLSSSEK